MPQVCSRDFHVFVLRQVLCSARRLGFKDLNLSFRYLGKGPGLSLALPAAKLSFSSAILSLPPPAGTARRHRPQALLPYSTLHARGLFLGTAVHHCRNGNLIPLGNLGLSRALARNFIYRRNFLVFRPTKSFFLSQSSPQCDLCSAPQCTHS